MGEPGNRKSPFDRFLRKVTPAGLAILIGAFGLPQILESVAGAAGSDRSPLLAPPGAPPGSIPKSDRAPVLSIPDENGVRNPEQVSIEPPTVQSPAQALAGFDPLPKSGGPNFDLYGTGPRKAAHVAVVHSQNVNYQGPDGRWQPVSRDLVPQGPNGWTAAVPGLTMQFPNQLGASSFIRVELHGVGTFSIVPEDADPSAPDGQATGSTVAYLDVLPGTDFVYTVELGGYKEQILLKDQSADGELVYDVSAPGLSLRAEPTGELSVLRAGTLVAVIPPAVAYDASATPAPSVALYAVDDLGGGNYRLHVSVDPGFLATATYPVTVDPGLTNLYSDTSDTYVDSADPTTDFSSAGVLWTSAGSVTRHTFVRFNTAPLQRDDRIVWNGSLFLNRYTASGSDPTVINRVTQAWPSPITWNSQPTVGEQVSSSDWTGTGYILWDVKSYLQHVLQTGYPDHWVDNGLRVSATGTSSHSYASVDGSFDLFVELYQIYYNDLPDAPTQSFPRDNYVSEDDSPTLKINGVPSDPNGDEVLVQYQVSDDPNDFTGSHLIWESAWTDERAYVVPSGILVDGQTYYWHARSWDICQQPDLMCSLTDGNNITHKQHESSSRAITIALKHFGDDPRWAMWSHVLGNGMTAKVNEANGNLFLDFPLDTLATAIGDLSVGLSYNSQQNADLGLTSGWDLAIGPSSSARDLPVELVKMGDPADFPDAGVKIRLGGGRAIYFPHRDKRVFAVVGSGAGVVKQNSDGTFLYTAADGSTYTFKSGGKLIEANPAASQPSSGANSLDYTFNGSDQLTQVTDPLGRAITVTWTNQKPSSISTWAGQTWTLSYSGGHMSSVSVQVTNPSTLPSPTTVTETVGFSYNGNGLLQEIDNGVTSAGSRTGWLLSYFLDPKGNYRVSTITAPGGGAPTTPTPWTFQYQAPYTGSTAATACVTDPLATPPGQFCTGGHQTKVDFNTAGLPIRIGGPADQTGYWPVTTLIWDSNNNLVCKRTPAANAVAEITGSTNCQNDALSTVFTYNNEPPYEMLTEKRPAPNPDGSGARVLDTYQYDSDTNGQRFNGLWVEKYGNKDLAGVPANEGVWSGFDQNWGAGSPPGVPGDGNNWSLRWSGYLNLTDWNAAKRAAFRVTTTDEGVTLIVGNTGLLDCLGQAPPPGYNCGTSQDVSNKLWPGLRPITIEYAELSGNASFKLEWDQGTGNWQVIPDLKLQTNLGLPVFKTTNNGIQDVTKTHYNFPDDDSMARRLPETISLTDILAPEELKTRYTYNAYGQMTTITTAYATPLAATTTNIYTNNSTTSCLTQVTGPTGAVTNYTCNAAGDVTQASQVVSAAGNQGAQTRVTTTEYDSLGRVSKVNPPSGGYTITKYDVAGRPLQLDRYLGTGAGHDSHAYTDYVYDDAGHPTDETFPFVPNPANPGQMIRATIHHVYDWLDEETSTTDVRGKVWQTSYDSLRRVVQTTSPSGLVASTEYRLSSGGSYMNRVTSWTPPGNPNGVATVTSLNVLGWKTTEQVGSINSITYAYDPLGNVTLVTDPAGVSTHYNYNGFNQATTRIDFYLTGSAATTTYTYDAAGRSKTVNGPRTDLDDSVTYDYDAANRLTKTTQNGLILPGASMPVETTYVWDDASERVRVTQPMSSTQNLVRNWTYDTSGRLATYADTKGTTTYTYGAANQLESVADPRNLTLKFEYDNLNRRTRRYAISGGTVDDQTFTYDLAGNMLTAKVVASGTTITMDYDNDARLSHVYQASYPTPTTTYTYSPSTGRLTSVVDPAGTTSYDYNTNGQLFHLTDPFNSSSQVIYGYDSAGRPSSRTDPAGLTWTRTYESNTGRLDTQTIVKAATTVGSFDLGYDPASNVTSRAETVKTETGSNNADSGTWTYAYDAANRMTSSTAPSQTATTYGYDGAGNRTSVKVGAGSPVTTTYDLAGLPTTSTDGTTYTHDAIGDLTKIDKTGGTANDWNLVYSSWGVLKTAAHKTTGTPDVAYTADAVDRVLSRVAGSTTTYTYRGTGEERPRPRSGRQHPSSTPFHQVGRLPGEPGPMPPRSATSSTTSMATW